MPTPPTPPLRLRIQFALTPDRRFQSPSPSYIQDPSRPDSPRVEEPDRQEVQRTPCNLGTTTNAITTKPTAVTSCDRADSSSAGTAAKTTSRHYAADVVTNDQSTTNSGNGRIIFVVTVASTTTSRPTTKGTTTTTTSTTTSLCIDG
jgi:hypothetical protein